MLKIIKKIISSEVLPFIFLKYSTNVISFIKIILLVTALGNYYYGIWGFILLLRQYLKYGNLGIHLSSNVLLSRANKDDTVYKNKIISNSFFLTFFMGLVIFIISLIISLSNILIFPQYQITNYIILIGIIVPLNYINLLFINIYRVYSKLYKIAIYQMLLEILLIPILFIYEKEILLNYLLYTIITIQFFGIIFFLYKSPFKIELKISKEILIEIIKKGISLLFYNASTTYLIISATTIMSIYFTVKEFGYYTFANSITNAIFIGISAISFVFFPKFINTLQESKGLENVIKNLSKIRKTYLPVFSLIIFLIIALSGVINYFFTEFNVYFPVLILLLISKLLFGFVIGYDSVIISRNKEKNLIIYGVLSISLNILLNLIFIRLFGGSALYVALFLVLSIYLYVMLLISYGDKLLNKNINIVNLIKIIPLDIYFLIILTICLVIFNYSSIYLVFLPIIYFIINYNSFKESLIVVYDTLTNKKSFEI